MAALQEKEIIKFLKANIDPLEDNPYAGGYRASVYLKDGTFLPCVIFRNTGTVVNLAIRRFKEEQKSKSLFSSGVGYWQTVKSFVANGNRLNHYDIATIDKSRYAFPMHIQRQIKSETSMGWTAFVAKFKDGRYLGFGTDWILEFFDLPDNYLAEDIVEIINHSSLLKTGEIIEHRSADRTNKLIGKEEFDKVLPPKQLFECYLDGL